MSKKKYTFCQIIHLPVFRCSCVVLVGDIDDPVLRRKYDAEIRKTGSKGAPKYDELVDEGCRNGLEGADGICRVDKGTGDATIILKEWRSPVFVHEAYHAVQGILEGRGIVQDERGEMGAHVIEYLFDQVVNVERADRNFKSNHK